MISKLGISISLVIFIAVGALLITGHPGVAIKTTNYLYFLVFATTIYTLVYEK